MCLLGKWSETQGPWLGRDNPRLLQDMPLGQLSAGRFQRRRRSGMPARWRRRSIQAVRPSSWSGLCSAGSCRRRRRSGMPARWRRRSGPPRRRGTRSSPSMAGRCQRRRRLGRSAPSPRRSGPLLSLGRTCRRGSSRRCRGACRSTSPMGSRRPS